MFDTYKFDEIQIGQELCDMHYGVEQLAKLFPGQNVGITVIRFPHNNGHEFITRHLQQVAASPGYEKTSVGYCNKYLKVISHNWDGDIVAAWAYDATTLGFVKFTRVEPLKPPEGKQFHCMDCGRMPREDEKFLIVCPGCGAYGRMGCKPKDPPVEAVRSTSRPADYQSMRCMKCHHELTPADRFARACPNCKLDFTKGGVEQIPEN